MNIDELRSAQSKERQKSDLQQLRESFYGDVAEYVAELEAERERAADAAEDPFGSPEVQQLTNDIETAKDTAEAIYERRLGKIVKKASLVSAEMANPDDVSGLTAEEQALFADLVDRIEENKRHMLEVIAGDAEAGAPGVGATDDDASAAAAGADAADAAAAEDAGASRDVTPTDPAPSPDAPHPEAGLDEDGTDAPPTEAPSAGDADADPASPSPGGEDAAAEGDADEVSAADLMGGDADPVARSTGETDAGGEPASPDAASDGRAVEDAADDDEPTEDAERATLRVTRDVGEIFGVDEREYDLDAEDVVTLPAANADVLLEQGAAERLD